MINSMVQICCQVDECRQNLVHVWKLSDLPIPKSCLLLKTSCCLDFEENQTPSEAAIIDKTQE